MGGSVGLEILVVFLLIVLNGVFAMKVAINPPPRRQCLVTRLLHTCGISTAIRAQLVLAHTIIPGDVADVPSLASRRSCEGAREYRR